MMQRIRAVLDKLNVLAQPKADRSVIDIDLMLDYTRMAYADLLDIRAALVSKTEMPVHEPTLDELTQAMNKKEQAPANDPPKPLATIAKPAAKDIHHAIDLNEKYLLLSGLFRNDMSAYEHAMKTINSLGTETEALQWLNAQQWPRHDDAQKSFAAVIARFYAHN